MPGSKTCQAVNLTFLGCTPRLKVKITGDHSDLIALLADKQIRTCIVLEIQSL
jgi:hypothetical protein